MRFDPKDCMEKLIQSRCAYVMVGSCKSHQLHLNNMVFHGPPLWNVFFFFLESSRVVVCFCSPELILLPSRT